jgi:hypothetical protein
MTTYHPPPQPPYTQPQQLPEGCLTALTEIKLKSGLQLVLRCEGKPDVPIPDNDTSKIPDLIGQQR